MENEKVGPKIEALAGNRLTKWAYVEAPAGVLRDSNGPEKLDL